MPDDEEDQLAKKELIKIKKSFGPREIHDSGESDIGDIQETGYEGIMEEEYISNRIAKREEAEQTRLIRMEEEEERIRRREKKRREKRLRQRSSSSD